MARIIPGVEVRVVKEVVPQQLAPSGILGLIGFTEKVPAGTSPVATAVSWNSFLEQFGRGSAHSMPQARLAIENGVFELVVVPLPESSGSRATLKLPGAGNSAPEVYALTARSAGSWANGLKAEVSAPKGPKGMQRYDLRIQLPGLKEWELFRNLSPIPGESRYMPDVLQNESTVATAIASADAVFWAAPLGSPESKKPVVLAPLKEKPRSQPILFDNDDASLLDVSVEPDGPTLRLRSEKGTVTGAKLTVEIQLPDAPAPEVAVQIDNLEIPGSEGRLVRELKRALGAIEGVSVTAYPLAWPAPGEGVFAKGADAGAADYSAALQFLADEPEVDMVLAAIQDFTDTEKVMQINSDIISHCQIMSSDCKGRIGFGEVPPTGSLADHILLAGPLTSDRFVLTSPHGVVGAVAGMIGSLEYYSSPTFKRISGVARLKPELGVEAQQALLQGNVVPVTLDRGRGIIVVRGLTTDGDQISVRRVADHAVRGVKMIGDLFIGRLNNAIGRSALRQKLTEFLIQMEREGSIVPSTDGSDPAFKVDVYSSQNDFALGIVRVDVAVRPVRAMDFIYATILVQV